MAVRILFVGNGLLDTDNYPDPNQGASVQTWGISQELAGRGNDVYILRRSSSKHVKKIENVTLVGITFRGIENLLKATFMSNSFFVSRLISSLYFSIKCLKPILHIKPDIICIIDRISGIIPASLVGKKLYIMHVPEALGFFRLYDVRSSSLNSMVFSIKKCIENSIMRKVDKVIALNCYIENYLKRASFANKIVGIPNGIDPNEFENNGDQTYVLYAGRFDWNKNVCSLVNAFIKIRQENSGVTLKLVGSGPEEEKIRSMLNENGFEHCVEIINWLPRADLKKIMSKCSVFVLPSLIEAANPVVLLEAMASSKPVIARTNMGTVDVIVNGKNGYLYSTQEELVKYLVRLMSDESLRLRMGLNARKTIETTYSFSEISDKYEKLFNQLDELEYDF